MIFWIYRLFASIDMVVYSVASSGFKLVYKMAGVNLFDSNTILPILTRVYIVVGVLMLFKLAVLGVQYIINPDSFDDKEKGFGGFLKKVATSIVLIVVIPAIFNFLLSVQGTVVKTIPKVILGNELSEKVLKGDDDNLGFEMSFDVLSLFVRVNTDTGVFTSIGTFVNNVLRTITFGMFGGQKVCVDTDKSCSIHDFVSFREHVGDECPALILKATGLAKCHYSYDFLISTICGAFLCYILLSMAVDIAIRSIKLGLIEVLAPIAISSYVFGKDRLKEFGKMAFGIYLDLFIRLIVIYFMIFAVKTIQSSGIEASLISEVGNDIYMKMIIRLTLIFGLLVFAKKAPKFVTELLGLSNVADSSINDMFVRAGGLAGITLAGAKTAMSNYTTQKERAISKGFSSSDARKTALKSAAAGFASATGRGIMMTSQGKGFKDVQQGAFKNAIAARTKRNDKYDNVIKTDVDEYLKDENGNFLYVQEPDPTDSTGKKMRDKIDPKTGEKIKIRNPEYYSKADYRKDVFRERMGIPSSTAFMKTRYDVMEKTAKAAAEAKSHGVTKMNETPDRYKIDLDLSTENGVYKDKDAFTIHKALGYEALTMEHVRNLYAMAKNGNPVEHADGRKVRLTDSEVNALGNLVQTIEKRTSYMKEAELMGSGDPAALPNFEKIRMLITNNKDMYNDPAIMQSIMTKFIKDTKMDEKAIAAFKDDIEHIGGANALLKRVNILGSELQIKLPKEPIYEGIEMPVMPVEPAMPTFSLTMPTKPVVPVLKEAATAAEQAQYAADFEQYRIDLAGYNQQMQTYTSERAKYQQQLQEYHAQKKAYDENYDAAKADYEVKMAQYRAQKKTYDEEVQKYEEAYANWLAQVNERANVLTAIKDSFEEVAKVEFPNAQFADIRAQKAQKAVNNSDKKGS